MFLFAEDKPVAGYLTSQPGTAGYLTMSRLVQKSLITRQLLANTFHCMFCLKVCDAQCAAADREQRQPRQQRPPDVELWA